jgi:hypothetical protein
MIIVWFVLIIIVCLIGAAIIYLRIPNDIYDLEDSNYVWAQNTIQNEKSAIKSGLKFLPTKQKIYVTMLYAIYVTINNFLANSTTKEHLNKVQILRTFINSVYQYNSNYFFLSQIPYVYNKQIGMALKVYESIILKFNIPKIHGELPVTGYEYDAYNYSGTHDILIDYCTKTGGSMAILVWYVCTCDYRFPPVHQPSWSPGCNGLNAQDQAALNRACGIGTAMKLTDLSKRIITDGLMNKINIPDDVLQEHPLNFIQKIKNNQVTYNQHKYFKKYFTTVAEPFYQENINMLQSVPWQTQLSFALIIYFHRMSIISDKLSVYNLDKIIFFVPAIYYYFSCRN